MFLLLRVLLLVPPASVALVTFTTPTGVKSWESATYVKYGPQNPSLAGIGVFLEGEMPCGVVEDPHTFAPRLVGKVVFVDNQQHPDCQSVHPAKLYRAVKKTKAAAIVLTKFYSNPPGVLSHNHFNLNPFDCEFCESSLVKLDISDSDFDFSLVEGVMVNISAPHIDDWNDYYTSPQWTVAIRIGMPIFALWTSILCILNLVSPLTEPRRRVRRGVAVAEVVWVIEAPTLFFVACFVALGQHGPQVLSATLHAFATSLFSGASGYTTVLMALFLAEENRALQRFVPRRDVLKHYRLRLICFFVFTLLADSYMLWYVSEDSTVRLALPFVVSGVHVVFIHIGASCFFFSTVNLTKFCLQYFRRI